ncbi:DUF6257 family protein [Streptomyces sp. NPDC002889]|uniref:DUF6257 family protein n=1 Tax=Streptomyces sp. NPDC002889 TaxID=3364669 RepID=UPI0036CD230D
MASEPRLTAGEKARVAVLVLRMAKRGIGDDRLVGRVYQGDLQRRIDRIVEKAAKREEQQTKRK